MKLQPNLELLSDHIQAADRLQMCLQANVCYEEAELVQQALLLLRRRVPGSPEWRRKRGLVVAEKQAVGKGVNP